MLRKYWRVKNVRALFTISSLKYFLNILLFLFLIYQHDKIDKKNWEDVKEKLRDENPNKFKM